MLHQALGRIGNIQYRVSCLKTQVTVCGCQIQFWKPASKTADCLGHVIIVVSDFDPILDRGNLRNWKVNVAFWWPIQQSCAGPLLKLEMQVMCITWVHRECTSWANACIQANPAHVHMFIYIRVTRCVCTRRKSVCAQLSLRVLSQHVWKEKATRNQISSENRGKKDEIAVDYEPGSRCATQIQPAASRLFPWRWSK